MWGERQGEGHKEGRKKRGNGGIVEDEREGQSVNKGRVEEKGGNAGEIKGRANEPGQEAEFRRRRGERKEPKQRTS